MNNEMFCSNCGVKNGAGARFCSGCGVELSNERQETGQNLKKTVNRDAKKYNTSGIVMLCIGIFLLIFFIGEFMRGIKAYMDFIGSICLISGGIYFMFNKKRYHWILYVIIIVVTALFNNIIMPLIG